MRIACVYASSTYKSIFINDTKGVQISSGKTELSTFNENRVDMAVLYEYRCEYTPDLLKTLQTSIYNVSSQFNVLGTRTFCVLGSMSFSAIVCCGGVVKRCHALVHTSSTAEKYSLMTLLCQLARHSAHIQ